VKNDVILEMAMAEITDTLYVFVDATDVHSAMAYTNELSNITWDLAVAARKPQLDIKIVSPACSSITWNDLLHLRELNVVYGELVTAAHDTKWLTRTQLMPVRYVSPALKFQPFARFSVGYFEDADDGQAKHHVVIANGTFDHLHNGHRKLLALAASVCRERLIIGITAAEKLLEKKPFAHLIEPLETRKRKVLEFVTSINSALTVEIVDVSDTLGPATQCTDSRLLVVGSTSDMGRIDELVAWCLTHRNGGVFMRFVRRTDRSTLSSSRIRERIASQ
jgi:cytidyltransferase-like protein